MTHAVVMKLVEPIEDLGHHVFMDNYYTSPQVLLTYVAMGLGHVAPYDATVMASQKP